MNITLKNITEVQNICNILSKQVLKINESKRNMTFENLTTQYLSHYKIRLLAACYTIQSLEHDTYKTEVKFSHLILMKWHSNSFSKNGRRRMQKLSRHADHKCRGWGGLEAPRTLCAQAIDDTCPTRSREGTLNSKGSLQFITGHVPVYLEEDGTDFCRWPLQSVFGFGSGGGSFL